MKYAKRDAIPSQIAPDVKTRAKTPTNSDAVWNVIGPTCFIPVLSRTLPRGLKITTSRIKKYVLKWRPGMRAVVIRFTHGHHIVALFHSKLLELIVLSS